MTKALKINAAIATALLMIPASIWWFSSSSTSRDILLAPQSQGAQR
jgi:hypothetical protein